MLNIRESQQVKLPLAVMGHLLHRLEQKFCHAFELLWFFPNPPKFTGKGCYRKLIMYTKAQDIDIMFVCCFCIISAVGGQMSQIARPCKPKNTTLKHMLWGKWGDTSKVIPENNAAMWAYCTHATLFKTVCLGLTCMFARRYCKLCMTKWLGVSRKNDKNVKFWENAIADKGSTGPIFEGWLCVA
jgi:hypothetical protein